MPLLLLLPTMLSALRNAGSLERVAGDLADDSWEGFCMVLSFAGLVIRGFTVGYVPEGTSDRNTKGQKAETLNRTGMYSIVRHPLYLGNFVIVLGITFFIEVWWFALIALLAFWLYYERIILAEEAFLQRKFGPLFSEWAEKTPAFLPKFKHWRQPSSLFSFKAVLRREYSGFFGIIVSFTFMEIVGEILTEGKPESEDWVWGLFFTIGLITYMTLRTLRKKTKILDVEAR